MKFAASPHIIKRAEMLLEASLVSFAARLGQMLCHPMIKSVQATVWQFVLVELAESVGNECVIKP